MKEIAFKKVVSQPVVAANPNPDLKIQYSVQIFVKFYLDLDFIYGSYMYLELDLL